MPKNLVRYQHSGEFHFLTFSCYHRRPYLSTPECKHLFESALERIRQRYSFVVAGYVMMHEYVHLLLSEPHTATLAVGRWLCPLVLHRHRVGIDKTGETWETWKPGNLGTDGMFPNQVYPPPRLIFGQVARSKPYGIEGSQEKLCPVHRVLCDERAVCPPRFSHPSHYHRGRPILAAPFAARMGNHLSPPADSPTC